MNKIINIDTVEIGDEIQFDAQRIMKGNPVKGKVISKDEEWIEVSLFHDIEGMATFWGEGENKTFRKSFLSSVIKIK